MSQKTWPFHACSSQSKGKISLASPLLLIQKLLLLSLKSKFTLACTRFLLLCWFDSQPTGADWKESIKHQLSWCEWSWAWHLVLLPMVVTLPVVVINEITSSLWKITQFLSLYVVLNAHVHYWSHCIGSSTIGGRSGYTPKDWRLWVILVHMQASLKSSISMTSSTWNLRVEAKLLACSIYERCWLQW